MTDTGKDSVIIHAPKECYLPIDDTPKIGSDSAQVKITLFVDYECPYCSNLIHDVYNDLSKTYIKTGKVQLIFRDYPLSFHENAFKLSLYAHSAYKKGEFELFNKAVWELKMGDFEDLKQWNDKNLSVDELKQFSDLIHENKKLGRAAGITGTPSIVINNLLFEKENTKEKLFESIDNALSNNYSIQSKHNLCNESI
ncbi:DsbA family protein [Flammeovirga aprica]|uniref:Thioredoxin domain-containing protein n=1 Tax=Flammeovirga aprica JL-4 TaxID=694437 RepID=A0A7X9RQ77_9BACT|nr:thioredoxin domain-containing protein [Flammeovirga aprica]NME66483.1 thioredoxin domain-containing protein [Flammeovirga aprica JL-4]